jgi:acetyl-CoA synthetase
VAEAAVISIPHPIKGECIVAYVVVANHMTMVTELTQSTGIATPPAAARDDNNTVIARSVATKHSKNVTDVTFLRSIPEELKKLVTESIGSFARPERIVICSALPKTRSGKIMRRLLKDIAQGKEPSGDLSTLENPALIQELIRLG